jgi:hypothetical protein
MKSQPHHVTHQPSGYQTRAQLVTGFGSATEECQLSLAATCTPPGL